MKQLASEKEGSIHAMASTYSRNENNDSSSSGSMLKPEASGSNGEATGNEVRTGRKRKRDREKRTPTTNHDHQEQPQPTIQRQASPLRSSNQHAIPTNIQTTREIEDSVRRFINNSGHTGEADSAYLFDDVASEGEHSNRPPSKRRRSTRLKVGKASSWKRGTGGDDAPDAVVVELSPLPEDRRSEYQISSTSISAQDGNSSSPMVIDDATPSNSTSPSTAQSTCGHDFSLHTTDNVIPSSSNPSSAPESVIDGNSSPDATDATSVSSVSSAPPSVAAEFVVNDEASTGEGSNRVGEDVADKLSQALGVDTDTERTIEFVDVDSEEGKKVLETMAAENKKINKQRPVMPLQHCVGVYCIFSAPSKNYYIGYTNKILIRIRIHNGELSKKLSLGEETLDPKKRPWILLFFIYGFPNCDSAQKLESAMHRPCQNRWLGASKCTFSKQPEGSKAIQYNSLHHILANLNILVHSPEHEHYTLTLVFFDEAQRAVWDFMVEKHRWTIRRGFTVENGFEDSRLLNHYTQLRSKPKPWEVEQTLARFSQDHKNADGFIDYVERVKTHLAKNGTQFTHPRVSKRLWCRVEPDGPGCSPLKSKQCFMMCTNKGCTTFGHAHCLFRVAARLKQSRRRNITFNSNQISSNCAKCRRPLNWTWMRTELSLRMRGAKDIVKLIEARDNEAIAAERRNKAEDKRTAAAERREHKVRARAAKVVEAEAKRARKAATDAARVVEHMKMAEESAKAAKENPDLDLEVYTYRNKTKPPGVGKRAEKAAQRRKEELEKAEKEAELQAEADAKAAEEEAEFEERRALGVLRFEDLERKRVLTKENGIEIQDEIRNPCEHCGTEKRYRYSGDAEDRYSNSQRQEKCEKRWDDLERACYIRLGCEQEMPWWRKRTKSKQVNRDRYQWEDIWDRLLHDETKPGAPGKLSYVERLLLGDQLHHASFAYWLGQKDQWRRPGLKRWQPSPYAIQRWCWSAGITGTKSWINPRTKDIKAVFRDLPKNMTCPKVWAKMHPKKKTSEEVDESRPLTRAQQSELNRQAEEANQREEQRGRENAEFASRMKAVAEHYETPANVPRTTMRLGIPSSSIESHSSSSSEMPGIFAPLATREPLTTPEDRHVHRAIRPSAFRDHSELVFSIFKDVWKLGVTTPQDMPETVDAFAAATFNASSATSPS